MCIATYHGIDRVREYHKVKTDRAAIKTIELALKRGKRFSDYTSWERTYLANKEYDECSALAYNGYCFIISKTGQCVTAYPLPDWFGEKKRFAGKEKIRNLKKYSRMNNFSEAVICA